MLTAITDLEDRRIAFGNLHDRLKDRNECAHYRRRVQRAGNGSQDVYWHKQARMWSVLRPPAGNMNRWWCAYGLSPDYPEGEIALRISVEINPTAAEDFDLSCAGVFARTPTRGRIFLCHKGLINGANMDFFKMHYRGDWTDVYVPDYHPNRVELAIIGSIDDRQLPHSIAEFAREADRIRNLANGTTQVREEYVFAPEFEGRRRRYSLDAIIAPRADHGLVVNTLASTIESGGYEPRNDQQRDLFIEDDSKRTLLLFEVKTDASTTSIYQGIGQLMLNGQAHGPEWSMVLVVPQAPDASTEEALGACAAERSARQS